MDDAPHAPLLALIAYDGSEGADAAVRAAARLLAGAHASVLFVPNVPAAEEHVALARIAVPDDVLATAARNYEREVLAYARERAESGRRLAEQVGFQATAETAHGSSAWREIRRIAHDLGADVIVCGSRGRGGFSRALLGSTSSSLLHHADRPVLLVPPGAGDLSGPALIAYDGSDGARAAIAATARLMSGRPVIVAHAWPSPLPEGDHVTDDLADVLARRGTELAEEGAGLAREAGSSARALAVGGAAGTWRSLAAAARDEAAAVIVAGCRGRGAVASTVLGSVSAGLAHNAELPVLIVR